MAHESVLKKIDETANLWNKTKDSKYKEQWYKLLKELNLSQEGKSDRLLW